MAAPATRGRLIDTFVSAIYLYDDKIVFAFNYKDGSKTVTMNERLVLNGHLRISAFENIQKYYNQTDSHIR